MAESSFKPYEVIDFGGGITDDVFNQNPRFAETIDNFNITNNNRLSSRPGSLIDIGTPADDQIPAGINRIGTLINYATNTQFFVQSGNELYYRNPTAYATLLGPTGNHLLSGGFNTTQIVSFTQWNKHIFFTSDAFPRPMKVFRDDSGIFQLRTSGLPALATDPVVTPGAVGSNTYIYAFHYEFTYMVDDQQFQDVGAITFVQVENSGDPSLSSNAITAIPAISNGTDDNWDTATITVQIFRTINGGSTFYKIGQVTNGTTVFTDNFADTGIQDNDLLYTTDGTVSFDPVPLSKFVHVVNNTGYYGSLKVGSETFPFTGRQSIPDDPDSCPESFEFILEDVIKGISSAKSVPIYLCDRFIYRIEGFFDDKGRGGANPIRISDTAGLVSNLSIVQALNGIFWAGNDGFYYSDGYQVIKISKHLSPRYKDLINSQTQANRIYGKFDQVGNYIYWGLQTNAGSLDNDSLWVLDLKQGISEEMPFSTWSGNSFRPTAIEIFNKKLYRADTRGYIFIHDSSILSDPMVDITKDAQDWHKEVIVWDYKSIHSNFGSTFFRKQPARALITAANRANTTIQVNAINDDGKSTRELKPIRWRKNLTWGDPEFVWGNPDCIWNAAGLIEQWRRFPAKGLRLSYLQLEITNGFSPITNSDTIGLATFDAITKTIVLDDALAAWPEDVVGYFISTEVDNYVLEFLVTARNDDLTIVVQDLASVLPTGDFMWVCRGLKKDEPLDLLSYNIFWNEVSQTQLQFTAAQSGENA